MKKMTGFATKVVTLLLAAALVLGTNGVRALAVDAGEAEAATATAAVIAEVAETQPTEETTAPVATTGSAITVDPVVEEPTVEKINDYYMVFSIAKADRVDHSQGTTFEGLKEIDYFQIKGVDDSDGWDRLYNEKHPNKNKDGRIDKTKRYNIRVNEAEIDGFMTEVAGAASTITNLNETDGNKIVAYPVERTETQNDNRKKVEAVLTKMGVLDTVTANVKTFVRNKNNSDLQKYLGKVYPDVNFDSDDWYIDWYVMKTQDNGIHVDGVFVTIYDLEEWTVVYNFVKVVDDEDKIVYSVPLDDTYSVRKGDKPDFTNDNVIETVSDITDKYTQDQCTLRVNADGNKFIFVENKETNKNTIEIFYELKEEKTEQPGDPNNPSDDPVNPNNPSDDPVNPNNPTDDPVTPQNPTDEPEKKEDPVVTITPVFVPDAPEEEPVVEEIPVEEPKTPEAAPEEEEIPVEEPGTPEGAPAEEEPEEEEIPVEVPTTPEGAPEEEEEEDIDVEIPETPEGDVLPQTGVASAAAFFGFGAGFIAIGAAVIGKLGRKEEI